MTEPLNPKDFGLNDRLMTPGESAAEIDEIIADDMKRQPWFYRGGSGDPPGRPPVVDPNPWRCDPSSPQHFMIYFADPDRADEYFTDFTAARERYSQCRGSWTCYLMGELMTPEPDGGVESWRCFHCGEVFTDLQAAATHFGNIKVAGNPITDPACQITVDQFRDIEHQLHMYQQEDGPKDRELSAMVSKHQMALQREEEKGYDRGLRDAKKLMGGLLGRLVGACSTFLQADRSEHLAVRLNDAEMAAVEQIRAAVLAAQQEALK